MVSNCQHRSIEALHALQVIKLSTDDGMVHFSTLFHDTGLINRLNFLYCDFNYFFLNIIGSVSLYKLDLQCKYRVSITIQGIK